MNNTPAACPKCAEHGGASPTGNGSLPGLRIALAGNPNSGKSTLFNALTGARQHTGNWPGKTVEKKVGHFSHGGAEFELIDLPGTYSLSAYSAEEIIARDFILEERPDAVVITLDASNLERNLYLAVQILELAVPTVVALNKSDVVDSNGIRLDIGELGRRLGAPVVRTVATRQEGLDRLVETVLDITAQDAS